MRPGANPSLWVASAALAGALAVGLAVPPPVVRDPAAALGGVRTVVVGSLFFRARALAKEGRLDEVAAAYRRILELDPTSVAATDHLASVLAYDLRLLAPTDEGRVGWWREADALVARASDTLPDDPVLAARRADLLLVTPRLDPAVARALRDDEAAGRRDVDGEALRALRAATADERPPARVGRRAIELVARHAPRVAAERFAAGRSPQEALALGEEVLLRHGPALSELHLDGDPEGPPALVVLAAGLRVVQRVAEALRGAPPALAEARLLVDTYAEAMGDDPVVVALRARLR